MLTFPNDNGEELEQLPLAPEIAQEIINSIFGTKRWENDAEWMLQKFRYLRRKAIEEGRRIKAEGIHAPEEDDWKERVRTHHAKNPKYWTVGRLANMVSQSPEAVAIALRA